MSHQTYADLDHLHSVTELESFRVWVHAKWMQTLQREHRGLHLKFRMEIQCRWWLLSILFHIPTKLGTWRVFLLVGQTPKKQTNLFWVAGYEVIRKLVSFPLAIDDSSSHDHDSCALYYGAVGDFNQF